MENAVVAKQLFTQMVEVLQVEAKAKANEVTAHLPIEGKENHDLSVMIFKSNSNNRYYLSCNQSCLDGNFRISIPMNGFRMAVSEETRKSNKALKAVIQRIIDNREILEQHIAKAISQDPIERL